MFLGLSDLCTVEVWIFEQVLRGFPFELCGVPLVFIWASGV